MTQHSGIQICNISILFACVTNVSQKEEIKADHNILYVRLWDLL